MDIKITQQPLLVWIWIVSTVLTIVDWEMGLGWIGGVAAFVFLAGVAWFLIQLGMRMD